MITEHHIDTLIASAQRLAAELQRLNHGSKPDIESVIQRVRMLQEPPLTTETPRLELASASGCVNDLVLLAARCFWPVAASPCLHILGETLSALVAFQIALTAEADTVGIRTRATPTATTITCEILSLQQLPPLLISAIPDMPTAWLTDRTAR